MSIRSLYLSPDGAAVSPPIPDAAPELPTTPSPTPAPAQSFDEAGAAFRAAKSWDELTTPQPAPVDPSVLASLSAEGRAEYERTGKLPVENAAPAADGEPAPVEFQQDEQGRWHRADGTFATAEEVAALEAVPSAETPAEPEEPRYTLAIPGAREGHADVEIEFAGLTPEQQEGLARLRNGYLRGEKARAIQQEAETYLAERAAFEAMLETNPEAVILQHLPAERQVSIATALIAQHWDAIVGQIAAFDQDPTQRVRTAMETQIAVRDQQAAYESRVQQQKYLTTVQAAVRALVPEGTADDIAGRFLNYAGQDLAAAIQTRGMIDPTEIPTLLAPTLRLFGFDGSPAPSAGAAPAPAAPARPVARPVARAAAAAATPTQAVPAGATVRRTVTAQRIAQATPPAGAGAATVSRPALPSNATLADAVALQKQQKTWGG